MPKEGSKIIRIRESTHKKLLDVPDSVIEYASRAIEEKIAIDNHRKNLQKYDRADKIQKQGLPKITK